MSEKSRWQKWTNSDKEALNDKLQQLKSIEQQGVIGQTIGNIKLTRLIGEGGMGKVYQAEHIQLKTPYAVKVLLPDLSTDLHIAERFRREAMMSSRLRHPHIVFITDFGFHEQLGLYLTMEYLDGRTLKQHLQDFNRGIPLWDAYQLMKQLLDALGFAHQSGVVHRDLKPENIFLQRRRPDEPEVVKVLDFGIARLLESGSPKLTMDGHVLGTPYYSAPEQILGQEITPQTDIYALGALLYEMLTGEPPFKGSSGLEIFSKHLMHAPPPLSKLRPELHNTQMNTLLGKALEKTPSSRPASTQEFHDLLQQALTELQELGITGAQKETSSSSPNKELSPTQRPSPKQKENIRLSEIFEKNKKASPKSMLSFVLQAQQALHSLSIPLFVTTVWSALLWDLEENETHSPIFQFASQTVYSLFDLLLEEASEPDAVPSALPVLQRTIRDLFELISPEKQKVVMSVLHPIASHHLFPHEFLPKWATAQTTGTWKRLRNVLSQDVRVLFGVRAPSESSGSAASQDTAKPQPSQTKQRKKPNWHASPDEVTRTAEPNPIEEK